MTRWRRDGARSSDDPFLRAIQARLEQVRAPEGLRARIGAMLAVELTHSNWEPDGDWPR